MNTRFAVLPQDIIDTLTSQLNVKLQQSGPSNAGLTFLRLPHPRTGLTSLFLPSDDSDGKPSKVLEVQSVSPTAARSWFNEGEVISDGSLLVLTPVDPAFLLLPILQASSPTDGTPGNFRTLEDLLEEGAAVLLARARDEDGGGGSGPDDASMSIYESDIMELGRLRCVQDAARHVCEAKEVNSELVVYRFSQSVALSYLEKKASRLSKGASIDKSRTLVRELAKDGLMDDGKEQLLEAGRLRLACDMISQYITPILHQELLARFDFAALDAYISSIQDDNMGLIQQGKANGNAADSQQDGGDQGAADGKKRKAATQASKGVEKLKKANVKGMAKLSTFFQKKGTKTKS